MASDIYDDFHFSFTDEMPLLRKKQLHIFFHFFLHFRNLITDYEGSHSLQILQSLQELKMFIKDFITEYLSHLEDDVYDGLMQLQDYIANYIRNKKLKTKKQNTPSDEGH